MEEAGDSDALVSESQIKFIQEHTQLSLNLAQRPFLGSIQSARDLDVERAFNRIRGVI